MNIIFDRVISHCPLCNRGKFKNFGGRNHFGYRIDYKICNYCTMIFMSPQMNDKTVNEFYRKEYRKLYQGNDAPTEREINFQFNRGRNQASFFESVIKAKGLTVKSYLDIGCSAGSHLLSIKELLPQVKLYGIEPGDAYREYCQSQGIFTFKDLEELKQEKTSFDAVSLSHVLEHISDPRSYLKSLRQNIMASNGVIMIEVPNTLGGHGAYEIAHPICFTKKTLKETMRMAGFDNIILTTHNVTQEDRDLGLYLLAIGFSTTGKKFRIKKGSPLLTKYLRRRGPKKESLYTTIKVMVRDMVLIRNNRNKKK